MGGLTRNVTRKVKRTWGLSAQEQERKMRSRGSGLGLPRRMLSDGRKEQMNQDQLFSWRLLLVVGAEVAFLTAHFVFLV